MADCGEPRSGFYADAEGGVCYRDLDFMGLVGYRVGDDGSVWSRYKQLAPGPKGGAKWIIGCEWWMMKPTTTKPQRGRSEHVLTLVSLNGKKRIKVHRLVLLAFAGLCPPGMEGCHFPDRAATNNALANLRWDTKKANARDSHAHGTSPVGARNPAAILTEDDVRAIRAECESGLTRRHVAKTRGVSVSTIHHIMTRRSWKHVV